MAHDEASSKAVHYACHRAEDMTGLSGYGFEATTEAVNFARHSKSVEMTIAQHWQYIVYHIYTDSMILSVETGLQSKPWASSGTVYKCCVELWVRFLMDQYLHEGQCRFTVCVLPAPGRSGGSRQLLLSLNEQALDA